MVTLGKRWSFALGGIVIALLAVVGVRAQTASQVTFSVSPTVFELSANPGDTLQEAFRIVNGTDDDMVLSATPKNFVAEGEDGGVNITEESTGYDLASWIGVFPSDVTIPARGSQIFNMTINVPIGAEPGGHFGSVIVKTEAKAVSDTGASISQEGGPLILVSIAGDVFEEASIVDFSPAKSFWEQGPVVLETRVENSGNVHFKPRGTIVIQDTFGNEVTTIDLEEKNVLPNSTRKLVNEWAPGFSVGRYTANLSLVYGPDDTIITSSTNFIIFPYKIIIPATLGAILFLYVLVRYRKRFSEAVKVLSGK